jgi:hypothetical protein
MFYQALYQDVVFGVYSNVVSEVVQRRCCIMLSGLDNVCCRPSIFGGKMEAFHC